MSTTQTTQTTQMIKDIKDYTPLTHERMSQIRELSHEDKMRIIQTLDEMLQNLVKFILYDKKNIKLTSFSSNT